MKFVVALFACALTGCADLTIGTSDISATDRSVVIPSGRISIDLSQRGESPAAPHTGHAIELGASGASGDAEQQLAAGELPIVFGGRTFNAPVALRHDFDWRFYEVAYRYRHFFGGGFGIEALGGLGFAELDFRVDSAGQSAREKMSNGGVLGGVGLLWKLRPSTSLQSRAVVFLSGQFEDVSTITRLEVYAAQALGRHAALRAGWSTWNVRSIREANDNLSSRNSPLRLRFSGPALGLDLAF
jgi:hypothetical protein